MADENSSEELDDAKLGGDYPPDEPMGVEEYGLTAQEERVDEPLADRIAREEPDFGERAEGSLGGDEDAVGRLVAPDEGVHVDDEAAAVATAVDDVRPDDLPVGDVGTGDSTTYDVATELVPELSAEEAAVHVREVP